MSWRVDWVLLATGLISLGLTMVQKGRAELLSLVSDEGQTMDSFLAGVGGLVVPACLLGGFVLRLLFRLLTNTWK